MKANLVFNLPEEQEDLDAALNGSKYKMLIDTLYDQVFRPHIKYDKPLMPSDACSMQPLTQEQLDILRQVWENVYRHFNED